MSDALCVAGSLSLLLCLVNLDDIIVFRKKNFEEHLQNIVAVLTALREAELKDQTYKRSLLAPVGAIFGSPSFLQCRN